MAVNGNVTYYISLCKSVPSDVQNEHGQCGSDTSVCVVPKSGAAWSAGKVVSQPSLNENKDGEMWLLYQGDTCAEDKSEKYTTIINFKCGTTMVCLSQIHF